jgi:hypothetical protein
MPNSTTRSDKSDSRNDEIVYGGNPLQSFDYDRQVNRNAKKKLGDTGVKIWCNTIRTPTATNRHRLQTNGLLTSETLKATKKQLLWMQTIHMENCKPSKSKTSMEQHLCLPREVKMSSIYVCRE